MVDCFRRLPYSFSPNNTNRELPMIAGQKWDTQKVNALYELPFTQLLFEAQKTHRQHFPGDEVELCTLLSVKTGACPEDCAYCPQSAHYQTGVSREKIMALEKVIEHAKCAKENGAIRFCMGAAWRNPPKKEFPKILAMIRAVKALGDRKSTRLN